MRGAAFFHLRGMSQSDFFGKQPEPEWVVFHDESRCYQEPFLYHGFLFVSRSSGAALKAELLQPGEGFANNYSKRIHFKELTGLGTERGKIALRWVQLAKSKWLPRGSIRFYCLGVNLSNINLALYRDSGLFGPSLPRKGDRVYRRFYEIGLRSALAWFEIPERVTHLYFDKGKQDIDRFNRSLSVCGSDTKVRPLENDCVASGKDLSKCLQLTDVLLGTVRRSFATVVPGAQSACIETFRDVLEPFLDESTAYKWDSGYYKKFCVAFFPSHNRITPAEFFDRDPEYHRKAKSLFYCNRKTHRQREEEQEQLQLWEKRS